ncbi:hypothetical protein WG922_17895 [Ramlibacter sp. AN1015]|uniref:hypothetical protein n=1 Tax=Ramlibacter sp. AN1015 TaxID=3133428 RepID=UPI0030BD32FA
MSGRHPLPSLRLLPWSALAAGLACVSASASAGPPTLPVPLRLPSVVSVQPASGVEIRYRRLEDTDIPTSPGRLEGIVSGRRWELRSSALLSPQAQASHRMARLDTGWQWRASGPLQTVVLGDTLASGGGWSRPVRLGGLRIGRPLALRPGFDALAPNGVAGAAALPTAAAPMSLAWAQASSDRLAGLFGRAPAPGLLPVSGPVELAAGASDYEFEAGLLRTGWGTEADAYGRGFAAAAWRRGLGGRMTGEARAEVSSVRRAAGLELVRGFGAPGNLVHGVVAQSEADGGVGRRWGLGLARQALGAAWRLSWDTFDREFTPAGAVPGEAALRSRLEAAVRGSLGRRLEAGLSVGHQHVWEAPAEHVVALSLRWGLASGRSLALHLGEQGGAQDQRHARVVLAIPLEPRRR